MKKELQKAIKILKSQGCSVVNNHDRTFQLRYNNQVGQTVTERELLGYARHVHSVAHSKMVKKFDNSKNRTATRIALQSGDYDKIPQSGKVKTEDPWAWD
jgi:hypothetical protein